MLNSVKIIIMFRLWHISWITTRMNQNLNSMKKIIAIAALAIVCRVATANAQCLGGFRVFGPRIGISIGIPVPVIPVPVIPPVGVCFGYPHPVGYYGGYRVAPRGYYRGYYRGEHGEHGGYGGHYGHRR
jgi:hypothetical protein